jgi:alpha-L-fucosidase
VKSIIFAAIGAVTLSAVSRASADERTVVGARQSVKELQEDFLKLKFGMFIHYNMATYKGVEWVAGYHSPADFNPGVDTIDTDAWADAAKSAGMTYGVLTVKHVAGFCLWDSKHTTYDVMHPECPYKKDLVAQFINSFESRGLKVGLYYCWRHPGFDQGKNKGKFKVLPPECDPATHSLEEQIEFQKKQIAELVEKYPDVFYIWNDALDDRIMPADEAQAFVRSLRPDIIASSNWWDWGKKGTPFVDIAVKEMRHFPEDNAAPGETCWKLEQTWFWKEGARAKTAQQALDLLGKANSRNSTFLLNVGPDRDGKIIETSIEALAEIEQLLSPQSCDPLATHSSLFRRSPLVPQNTSDQTVELVRGNQRQVHPTQRSTLAGPHGERRNWAVLFARLRSHLPIRFGCLASTNADW